MSSEDGHPPSSNYRKPPVEHRFKKGQSGNPNGRPPKKKAGSPGLGALDGGGVDDRLGLLVMEEAARPITVRERGQSSEMPALQALLRSMFMASAQGDTRVGRQLLDLISRAEATRTKTAIDTLQGAKRYKEKFTPIFDQHARARLNPPNIHPHPDDVLINEARGEVTIDGPLTEEEAGAEKVALQLALDSKRRYGKVKTALTKDPANRALRREFEELNTYQELNNKIAEREQRRKVMRLARHVANLKSRKDDPTDEA